MERIKAIFVDFDGTLVDSEYANALAYSEAIQLQGWTFHPEVIMAISKGRHWSIFLKEIIGSHYSEALGYLISEAKRNLYPKYFQYIQPSIPIVQLLASIEEEIPKVLVTNASRESVKSILTELNLNNIFKFIVSKDDVAFPKPSPDLYFLALKILDVDPSLCLAIEDSEAGMRAASLAKIPILQYRPFNK